MSSSHRMREQISDQSFGGITTEKEFRLCGFEQRVENFCAASAVLHQHRLAAAWKQEDDGGTE